MAMLPTSAQIRSPIPAGKLPGRRLRPARTLTPTLAYIVVAPFFTGLLLALHSWWGLFILFGSHALLILHTLLPRGQGFGPIVTRFETVEPEVWLTIDDGPDPLTTPGILEVLARHQVSATFFLVGDRVREHPGLAAQVLAAGHHLGNHSQTHPQHHFWGLSPMGLRREIDGLEEVFRGAGLPVPALFRAPVGMANPFLHFALEARGLVPVAWSVRSYDTRHRNVDLTVRRLLAGTRPGAILLVHDGLPETAPALDLLLAGLKDRGYRAVVPSVVALRAGWRPGKDCAPKEKVPECRGVGVRH
ncbi:MAG TPA: polysaccharide deacetylase family protein [Chthoniobacterales bacterium]